jgi:hypothetical protein
MIGSTTSDASLFDSTEQRKRLRHMELCARMSWMSEANSGRLCFCGAHECLRCAGSGHCRVLSL